MTSQSEFQTTQPTPFDFDPNTIAPSLSKVKLDDFTDPDMSWLMDGEKYFMKPDEATGLNPLQERKLREKADEKDTAEAAGEDAGAAEEAGEDAAAAEDAGAEAKDAGSN